MVNFLAIEQDWLRAGLRWHGKVGLEDRHVAVVDGL
jgi:hypothetical protein